MEIWSKVQDYLQVKLHTNNGFCSFLAQLESQTGVNRVYIFLIPSSIASFILLLFALANIFDCMLLLAGLLYPSQRMITAIESRNEAEKERWYKYYIIYAAFMFGTHVFLDHWFTAPAYLVLKAVFLGWLSYEGAIPVYRNASTVLAPVNVFMEDLDEKLHDESSVSGAIVKAFEQHSGVPVLTVILLPALPIWLIYEWKVCHNLMFFCLCQLWGIGIPGFSAYYAMRHPTIGKTKWHKYWIVYSVIQLLTFIPDNSYSLSESNLYWFVKAILLVWCCFGAEGNNGSHILYEYIKTVYFTFVPVPSRSRRPSFTNIFRRGSKN